METKKDIEIILGWKKESPEEYKKLVIETFKNRCLREGISPKKLIEKLSLEDYKKTGIKFN